MKNCDNMSIEEKKNRDLFLKMCFMYFLMHILNVLGIDEEIEDILPTELITLKRKDKIKIFDDLHDFRAITKSGKIIIFEFKKNMLRKDDLEQVYNYLWNTSCKEKTDVIAILIVISKEGKIKEYNKLDITFHPKIIKTKTINKQKDLKEIRDKFENNKILTSEECSLLIALPLFELEESEEEIVYEMCQHINDKKHCIPKHELDGVLIGMYLNIVEYIDSDKQDELKEMINMEGRTKGVFAQWKEEQRNEALKEGIKEGKKEGKIEGIKEGKIEGKIEGITQGEKNIILELLKNNTMEEVGTMIHKDVTEIQKIIGI